MVNSGTYGYHEDGFEYGHEAPARSNSVEADDGLLHQLVTPLSHSELLEHRKSGKVGHPVVELSLEEIEVLKLIEEELS